MDTAVSLHCARCDYDLRTLDPAGACPECALPIERSVQAANNPLAPDRRRIRAATSVLLAAMTLRGAITLGILACHIAEGSSLVYSSVASQLLDLWPIDLMIGCAVSFFHPNGYWIFVRALLMADFLLRCAGIAMLTRPLRVHQPRWSIGLRRISRWSAAASVGGGIVVWMNMHNLLRYSIDLFGANQAVFWCLQVLPPVALVGWTVRLLLLATRDREGDPPTVARRVIATYGVLVTVVAAVYNARWIYETGVLGRFGALMNVATFLTVSWMWWDLRRRTHPPGASADTMP